MVTQLAAVGSQQPDERVDDVIAHADERPNEGLTDVVV
jgi:hypothetical protein